MRSGDLTFLDLMVGDLGVLDEKDASIDCNEGMISSGSIEFVRELSLVDLRCVLEGLFDKISGSTELRVTREVGRICSSCSGVLSSSSSTLS